MARHPPGFIAAFQTRYRRRTELSTFHGGARVVAIGVAIGVADGLATTHLPARRASNVDPLESLRGD